MYMILRWLEEIKIQRTAERWFSTSFSGGFGPTNSASGLGRDWPAFA
jgi:hypothetical protein